MKDPASELVRCSQLNTNKMFISLLSSGPTRIPQPSDISTDETFFLASFAPTSGIGCVSSHSLSIIRFRQTESRSWKAAREQELVFCSCCWDAGRWSRALKMGQTRPLPGFSELKLGLSSGGEEGRAQGGEAVRHRRSSRYDRNVSSIK